jgi:hypothetical protein
MAGKRGPAWSVEVTALWPALHRVAAEVLLRDLERKDVVVSGSKGRVIARFTVKAPSADAAATRGVEVICTILGPAARVVKVEALTYRELKLELG